ncbi:hypothetical protein [Algoriphagus faecimaris]|nr:hypothetical protein [Algoriphagus faecimaris]
MKKNYCFSIGFLALMIFHIVSSLGFAQSLPSDVSSQINKITPKSAQNSPNAASIQKYGDFNVNLFTGTPEISIPLFEIEAGPIKVPITLSYHASGIRYSDRASWAGLGWTVQVGGQVTRNIIGKPDESSFLTLSNNYSVDPFAYCDNIDYKQYTAEGNNDREPDLFSYSFPGGSGRFLLRQNGESPLLFPESAIKVVRNPNYFDITDTRGHQYRFGSNWDNSKNAKELLSSSTGSTNLSGVVTWYLQEIKAPNSDDYVSFTYQNVGTVYSTEIETNITLMDECNTSDAVLLPCQTYNPVTTLVQTYSSISQFGVEEIFFKTGKVVFVLGNDRTDLPGSSDVERLQRIEVYSKLNGNYTLEKSFVFMNNGNFKLASNNGDAKLKLDGLEVRDGSNTLIQKYNFTYQTTTFSWDQVTGSHRRDLFGFYNGKTSNTNLIPQETVQYHPVTSQPPTTISIGGANRTTDTTFYKQGLLKRITFPTGGYTEFEFEPHKYSDLGTTKYGSGLRIKKITKNDGQNNYFTLYKYGNNEDGLGHKNHDVRNFHFLTTQYKRDIVPNTPNQRQYRVRSWVSNSVVGAGFDDSPVVYTKVTEYANGTNANGKTIYEFDNNVYIGDGVYTVQFSNKTWRNKKSWERGKLTNISKYDSQNNLKELTEKTYTKFKGQSLLVGQAATQVILGEEVGNFFQYCTGGGYPFDGYRYMIANISQDVGVYLETSSKQTLYYGGESIEKRITREFHPTYLQLSQEESNTSPNPGFTRNVIRYNYDIINPSSSYSGKPEALKQLLLKNVLTPVEEYTVIREPSRHINVIAGKVTEFAIISGTNWYQPKDIYFLETASPIGTTSYATVQTSGSTNLSLDSRYKLRMTMNGYDSRGNLIQYSLANGMTNSFLYAYDGSYVIAEATNAAVGKIAYTSFETNEKGGWTYSGPESSVMLGEAKTGRKVYLLNNGSITKSNSGEYKLSFWVRKNSSATPSLTINGSSYSGTIDNIWRLVEISGSGNVTISGSNTLVDELRFYPKISQMITYTHKPLTGVSSQMDPKNQGLHYYYDPFGRLSTIKNDYGHILKHYEYSYIDP